MMRVIGYSQLVQRLLALEVPYGPLSDSSKVYQSQSITARGAMTHRIIHLGPARDRSVASIAANTQWRRSFATYFSLPQDVQLLLEATGSIFPGDQRNGWPDNPENTELSIHRKCTLEAS
jgi:hypothetical protein